MSLESPKFWLPAPGVRERLGVVERSLALDRFEEIARDGSELLQDLQTFNNVSDV